MKQLIQQLEKSFIEISELLRTNDSYSLENYVKKYNISGDDVKQADILSNIILKKNLSECSLVKEIGSEEETTILKTEYADAPYLVCFDPLDGSSNIGVNITTGTIFGVYKYDSTGQIKSGRDIVLAGYCLYGGATQYVIANSEKVSMYQLNYSDKNKMIREFTKIQDNIKIPKKGMTYSFNDSKRKEWIDKRYEKIIDWFIEKKYSARWVGTLVADGHRTLLKGGFFAYPANISNKSGKIRLLYESYPFAYIFEKAGGQATDGNISLLDIEYPKEDIHFKSPIILSSCYEMLYFNNIST